MGDRLPFRPMKARPLRLTPRAGSPECLIEQIAQAFLTLFAHPVFYTAFIVVATLFAYWLMP